MEEKSPISRPKYVLSDATSESENESDGDLDVPLEKLNLVPKKKLLILCLGGLLVLRVHTSNQYSVQLQGLRPDVVYGNFRVYKRPFCTEFMNFCFERFEVGLWSAAREYNIDGVLRNVTGGKSDKLLFVWGQEECTKSPFKTLNNPDKPIFLKQLNELWENKAYKGKFSASNTLLIDDDPHACLLNPPDTSIFPPPYKTYDKEDTFLGPNGELQRFLSGLADADDVPSYVKDHRIGQPEITPSHPDWYHYAEVVSHYGKKFITPIEGSSSNE